MNWNDLRFFLAVARRGGLSAAVGDLNASPSRISRRIAALEAALGVTLFHRSLDGYALTDEGLGFLPRAEEVEAAALSLQGKTALWAGVVGRVRVATAETFASLLLAPHLTSLLDHHPHLTIDLMTGVRAVDLARHEADLALRLIRPTGRNIRVRKLGHMACAVYRAIDAEPASFAGWSDEFSDLPVARALRKRRAPTVVVANSLPVHQELAAGGAVKAVLPCFIGETDPRLERTTEEVAEAGQDIWLAINPDVAGTVRVRAVVDFICERVERARDVLDPPRAEPLNA